MKMSGTSFRVKVIFSHQTPALPCETLESPPGIWTQAEEMASWVSEPEVFNVITGAVVD